MADWNLPKLPSFAGVPGPVVVCVMDGVGSGAHDEGDAVWLARTPTLDRLAAETPTTFLAAHGTAVGMPSDGDMGNSEVGHNALGAGRTFDQGAKLVDNAIASGSLFSGTTWKQLIERCRSNRAPLHFIGLLSDGNVHSHIDHLFALLDGASEGGIETVRLHMLLDGRDVPETSALEYIERLERHLAGINEAAERDYRIASGGGRMTTTMDRYNANWRVVEQGWQAHVLGRGRTFKTAAEAIETYRGELEVIDQDLPSFVVVDDEGKPLGPIEDGAGVVFFNFRGDRAIELSRAFDDDEFTHFDRERRPDVLFAGMMEYDGDTKVPRHYLVSPPLIDRTLGEYLANNGISQLAISETQKYGHVTYFWNGNRSGCFDPASETYIEVPSDVIPFEQRPWMKAAEITDKLIAQLQGGEIRHARLNFANGDMVGHTGKLDAAVLAVAAVDLCLQRILPVIAKLQGAIIVTADHGNADEMFELDKDKHFKRDAEGRRRAKTSHTLNKVPLHVYAPSLQLAIDETVKRPSLSNVAATVLQLLGRKAPSGYEPGLLAL